MSIKPFSDRTTIPFGIGVLATLVVVAVYMKVFPELRTMREFPRHHP